MPGDMDILGLFLKVFPYLLGYRPQEEVSEASSTVLTEKDVALINLRNKDGSVTVVLGSRDTGKTELAYRLMEFFGRPCYAISPQQTPPSWIKKVKLEDVFDVVPPGSTLLCDDLPSYMGNRDYHEELVKTLEKVIPMVRHAPHPPDFPLGQIHLIFASQSAAAADRYILDCDAAFLKPLGLLMGDIERPNIARLYKTNVNPLFDGKGDMFTKTHAYMISRTFKGLIEVSKTT